LTYKTLVLKGSLKLPDFASVCPICKGKDCAVRHGFYMRFYFDFFLKNLLYIPVFRFLCRRKNKKFKQKNAPKTFSLLPSNLIPFRRYDAHCLLFIARKRYGEKLSLLSTALKLCGHFQPFDLNCSCSTIFSYQKLFAAPAMRLAFFLKKPHLNDVNAALLYFFSFKDKDIPKLLASFFAAHRRFLFGISS